MQEALKSKKPAHKALKDWSGAKENYKRTKKEAKKAVAIAKGTSMEGIV